MFTVARLTHFKNLGCFALGQAKKLAPWAVPGALYGGWLVWPAITDNFKKSIGL